MRDEALSATRAAGFSRDVVVIGGCGHVGLPLAIALADRGAVVGIYDVSQAAVDRVNAGLLPFDEPGAGGVLAEVVAAGRLRAEVDPGIVSTAEAVVVVIGTPVDEHLNPDQTAIPEALGEYRAFSGWSVGGVAFDGVPGCDGVGGEDVRGAWVDGGYGVLS